MKWDNIDYHTKRRLESEYDKRHHDKMPQQPEFEPIQQQARQVIETDFKTDLYVAMPQYRNTTSKGHSVNLLSGYLRLVASDEHIEIQLKPEILGDVIAELTKLQNDLEAFNQRAKVYNDSLRQYKQDMEHYKELRQARLSATFDSGKYTQKQIENGIDQIPF